MKRLSKLIITLIGVLSLTSCMSLMPTVSRRSKSSSQLSEDEISEKSNQKSSSSLSYDPYDCHITCSNNYARAEMNEMVHVRFTMTKSNGEVIPLSSSSYIEPADYDIYYDQILTEEYLEAIVSSPYIGTHGYRVCLFSKYGQSCRDTFYFVVDGDEEDPNNYYVSHPEYFDVPNGSVLGLDFMIVHRVTGSIKRFDPSHPFDADISDAPSIYIDGYELLDDNTLLRVYLKGIDNTASSISTPARGLTVHTVTVL